MAHIGSGPGTDHRPRFQRKLRRLLRLGASARFLDDVECYDGTVVERYLEARRAAGTPVEETPFNVAIRSDLEAGLLEVVWVN
jgi:hypothetical protein